MTLDEAIEHAKEVACDDGPCTTEHAQLADWLSELKMLRTENESLRNNNAGLSKVVRDMWDFYCFVPDEPHTFKEELEFDVRIWKRMNELGI